uniref:Ig-like domain-containing protein n=1 Tax=Monopterus albus TaxID=43700 RepID=A0A3Q3ITJ0_MONAL
MYLNTATLLVVFYLNSIVSPVFTIRNVTLTIEPGTAVARGTNVTVRCNAVISSSGGEALSREYTIYKDSMKVYTKTSSTAEDLLYPLPDVRVSNTGKYKCEINIEGKQQASEVKKLTVTGLSKPVLHTPNVVVSEQGEVTATCRAPGETGSIYFYFYEDSNVILENQASSNLLETRFHLSRPGIHKIHCTYSVFVMPEVLNSEKSNTVTVSVQELNIAPVMKIFPQSKIYEGDHLTITCSINTSLQSSESVHLYLSQGTQLLSTAATKVNHSLVALVTDPGEFECRAEIGNVAKVSTEKISVTELFSAPTLTMSPAEVFQREYMTLTCKSESYAAERLNRRELTYTLEPPENLLVSRSAGVFTGKALPYDFNYTCVARARGIVKRSETLTVRPKVSVSTPKISVVGRAVLGQPFKILCQSDTGSLPINYTLLKDNAQLSTTSVKQPFEQALFTVTINESDEINKYVCAAKNNHRGHLLSKKINATVIVPLSRASLTVIPTLTEISEGDHLYLICGIKGTPPITFKWYRLGNRQPLLTNTSNINTMDYQVHRLSKEHSGTYYCEAINHANTVVRSEMVTIEVHLALWKKALIGGFCLLVVSVLVVVLVLYFKSKRGKREAAAELSVKPSSPKSDDSLTVNLTHNTEVYKAATGRLDRAADSVWSERPPEAASDEVSSVVSSEPDVEYTEVVHPQPVDPARGEHTHNLVLLLFFTLQMLNDYFCHSISNHLAQCPPCVPNLLTKTLLLCFPHIPF